MTPGSMPLSRDIFQEGIRIPPLKLIKRGVLQREVLDLILANVRTPEERGGYRRPTGGQQDRGKKAAGDTGQIWG